MPSRSKASRTLDTLEADIRKLRKKARQLETQLDDNFTYFQQHSGTLFVRSLLPKRMEGVTNERLQKVYAKLVDMVAEKLGDGLNWLINRVFKK